MDAVSVFPVTAGPGDRNAVSRQHGQQEETVFEREENKLTMQISVLRNLHFNGCHAVTTKKNFFFFFMT